MNKKSRFLFIALSLILMFILTGCAKQTDSTNAYRLPLGESGYLSEIDFELYKKKDITYNNLILSYAISSILGIILYLLIYIPLNDIFGHKIYIAITLLFLIFIFIQVVSYYIMNYKKILHGNELGILLIIIIYFIFGYFTYHPLKINLFYDYVHKGFGIIKSSLH